MSFEEVEPQWLRDYRDEVLDRRESDRESDLRDLERVDERDSALWMMWLPRREN